MTPHERVAAYSTAGFPNCLSVGEDGRIVGTWVMGNDYRVKSKYYGGYPNTYLRRVRALFPDKKNVLHVFSGKVNLEEMPGKTLDVNPELRPDYCVSAHAMSTVRGLFGHDLFMCDPPYSEEDAEHYGTPMIRRNAVMAELSTVAQSGAHVVWLDQVLPMYRKADWTVEGYVGIVRSTNHRFRVMIVFRRR